MMDCYKYTPILNNVVELTAKHQWFPPALAAVSRRSLSLISCSWGGGHLACITIIVTVVELCCQPSLLLAIAPLSSLYKSLLKSGCPGHEHSVPVKQAAINSSCRILNYWFTLSAASTQNIANRASIIWKS